MKIFNLIHEKNFKLNLTFLKIVLILSFVLISINFYEWTVDRSYYEYSDWLINYQGGFTRRGLGGEINIFLADFFSLPLRDTIFFFQATGNHNRSYRTQEIGRSLQLCSVADQQFIQVCKSVNQASNPAGAGALRILLHFPLPK